MPTSATVRSYVVSLRGDIPQTPEPEYEQLPLLPDGGGIDLAALRKQREAIRYGRRLAPETIRSYAIGFRCFNQWCRQAGKTPLPATDETLCLFATWMLTVSKYKVGTAVAYVNAVIEHHRMAGVDPPSARDAYEVCAAVKRRGGHHKLGKQALAVKDLRRACEIITRKDGDTNRARRDLAVMLVGFATSLRRSELVALELEDLKFRGPGFTVLVKRAKNDQQAEGRIVGVWAGERQLTDPVRALKRWLEFRGSWPGPLFTNISRLDVVLRQKMGGARVCDVVKNAVARAGLDPTGFGAHSLRSGAITASADRGRSDRELMRLSGHKKADSLRSYVKESEVFSGRNPLPGVL